MNVIEVTAVPKFWFNLTAEELALLMKHSDLHYDSACRNASQVGGFIYGWKNALNFRPDTKLDATGRELDTCCKILEGAAFIAEDIAPARELSKAFHKALRTINSSTDWMMIEVPVGE